MSTEQEVTLNDIAKLIEHLASSTKHQFDLQTEDMRAMERRIMGRLDVVVRSIEDVDERLVKTTASRDEVYEQLDETLSEHGQRINALEDRAAGVV